MRFVAFNIPASGHVNPTLPVVAELVSRGAQVTYYCTDAYRDKIEATGATFRAYSGAPQDLAPSDGGVAAPFVAMRGLLTISEQLLPRLIADVRGLHPDAVIFDSMTVWGKQVGQAFKLPLISSCAIFPVCSRNFRALPQDMTTAAQMALRAPELIRALLGYRKTAVAIQQKFGLSSPSVLDFFANPGDRTVVFTSREFMAGAELFDDSFKFIGLSIAPRDDAGDFPIQRILSAGRRIIYISLGTLFNRQTQFFRDCIAAFRDAPFTVVMSIGKSVRASDLGDIPANFIVQPFVPQLDVLQRASVFITHGGMNSASEAMWFGVPMVVVPQAGDQMFIGQRIAQLGAGALVKSGAASPGALRNAVLRVLEDETHAANARKLGDSLRAAGGYTAAATEICRFVEGLHAPRYPDRQAHPASKAATHP